MRNPSDQATQKTILVTGLPGSGKSYFTWRLAEKLKAIYLSTDRIRNEILNTRTYSRNERMEVYEEMKKRMMEDPQPFDCIEYNDDFRQIDVLDEVAFLCMDLEYHNRPELVKAFLDSYLAVFSVMKDETDRQLFIFYKSYRAQVRTKVIGLQAEEEEDPEKQTALLDQCLSYLELMKNYLIKLS